MWKMGIVLLVATAAWAAIPATQPATGPAAVDAVERVRGKLHLAGLEPLVQKTAYGEIDWTRGVIVASGEGKAEGQGGNAEAMALRAARVAAARNAILLVGALRLDPQGRPANIPAGRLTADAVLKDFAETSSSFDSHSRVACVSLSAPIYGVRGVIALAGLTIPVEGGPHNGALAGGNDIMVIDARQTGFAPTLGPRLASADGKVLFDAADLQRQELSQRPVAIYVYRKSTGIRRDASSIVGAAIARAKSVAAEAGSPDQQLLRPLQQYFQNPLVLNAAATAKEAPGTLVVARGSQEALDVEALSSSASTTIPIVVIVTDFELK